MGWRNARQEREARIRCRLPDTGSIAWSLQVRLYQNGTEKAALCVRQVPDDQWCARLDRRVSVVGAQARRQRVTTRDALAPSTAPVTAQRASRKSYACSHAASTVARSISKP